MAYNSFEEQAQASADTIFILTIFVVGAVFGCFFGYFLKADNNDKLFISDRKQKCNNLGGRYTLKDGSFDNGVHEYCDVDVKETKIDLDK